MTRPLRRVAERPHERELRDHALRDVELRVVERFRESLEVGDRGWPSTRSSRMRHP